MCQSRHSTRKANAPLKGSGLFSSAVFGREGHISRIPLPDHSFSGSKAKCSHSLEADARDSV